MVDNTRKQSVKCTLKILGINLNKTSINFQNVTLLIKMVLKIYIYIYISGDTEAEKLESVWGDTAKTFDVKVLQQLVPPTWSPFCYHRYRLLHQVGENNTNG
ncbi:hypothetical protein ACE6H2_001586 [Prunus campanulata]